MPQRFFFGPPWIFREYVPQEAVDALLAVSEIPERTIDSLAVALRNESGFLDRARLAQVVHGILPDERLASGIVSTLESLRREKVDDAIRALRRWRDADGENAAKFPGEALSSLESRLPRLIEAYPAMERYRKARRLASMTGNVAESLEVICDLRPVFNEKRDRVEGIVPITTLRLEYERQGDETAVLEVVFSREMLDELVQKAQTAQQKLKVLSVCVSEWIPDGMVKLT